MAGPTYYDAQINIALNADWVVQFQYGTYAPDGVTIIPVDLTGSTVKMEIRLFETDHEALVSVSTNNGGIYFLNGDPTTGQFVIAITRDRQAHLFAGNFVADIVRLLANGYQERIVDATVTVAEGTTR
jgi:hypothetical protein